VCGCVLGSSVSLAPSLISIYDRAVSTSGGEAETVDVAGWYDATPAAAAAAAADIDRLATSTASPSRSSTLVKRSMSSAAAMVLPGAARPEVDMKKRPLSIRSTSSTASTVSATQRRRRKKQAVGDGVAVSGASQDEDGDLPTLTERLTQQAASYSDELNSLTSSLLERSESDSSGGAVRLSSLLTDDDDQEDLDVSPASDCSDHQAQLTSTSRSESYVDLVVAEILDTERAYVNDLHDVIQVIITLIIIAQQFVRHRNMSLKSLQLRRTAHYTRN